MSDSSSGVTGLVPRVDSRHSITTGRRGADWSPATLAPLLTPTCVRPAPTVPHPSVPRLRARTLTWLPLHPAQTRFSVRSATLTVPRSPACPSCLGALAPVTRAAVPSSCAIIGLFQLRRSLGCDGVEDVEAAGAHEAELSGGVDHGQGEGVHDPEDGDDDREPHQHGV